MARAESGAQRSFFNQHYALAGFPEASLQGDCGSDAEDAAADDDGMILAAHYVSPFGTQALHQPAP